MAENTILTKIVDSNTKIVNDNDLKRNISLKKDHTPKCTCKRKIIAKKYCLGMEILNGNNNYDKKGYGV
jgi:hypothetical protein